MYQDRSMQFAWGWFPVFVLRCGLRIGVRRLVGSSACIHVAPLGVIGLLTGPLSVLFGLPCRNRDRACVRTPGRHLGQVIPDQWGRSWSSVHFFGNLYSGKQHPGSLARSLQSRFDQALSPCSLASGNSGRWRLCMGFMNTTHARICMHTADSLGCVPRTMSHRPGSAEGHHPRQTPRKPGHNVAAKCRVRGLWWSEVQTAGGKAESSPRRHRTAAIPQLRVGTTTVSNA